MTDIRISRPDAYGIRSVSWTEGGRSCVAYATSIQEAWRIYRSLSAGDASILRY